MAWQTAVVGADPGLRAVSPEAVHVTLCFLGMRAADEVGAIEAACETVRGWPAGRLGLGEPLWLPPRAPRVLALSISDESGALARVQAELSGALARAGVYEAEKRPFLPHVTAARVRRGHAIGRRRLAPPDNVEFCARTIVLYRSHLGPDGATYEQLGSVGLATPSGSG